MLAALRVATGVSRGGFAPVRRGQPAAAGGTAKLTESRPPTPALQGPAPVRQAGAAVAPVPASASAMSALDPRWIVALRTRSLLEGGAGAIMTPQSRRYIVELADHLGLRAFDAHLIIAIVQDGARSGAGPSDAEATQRLAMIAPARSGGNLLGGGPAGWNLLGRGEGRGALWVYGFGLACAAIAMAALYARVLGVG